LKYKTKNVALSQQLDQIREARIDADYRLNQACLIRVGKQNWRQYAEETMQLAASILPQINKIPSY
jgi:hypothetical protein